MSRFTFCRQHACALTLRIRQFLFCIALASLTTAATAATITVNSLADDVFPDATGALLDAADNPVVLSSSKCTLRMAIAASNLNTPVGGAFGCPGDANTDTISFDPGLTSGGPATIPLNAAKRLPTPAYTNNTSVLVITGSVTVNGPTNNALSVSAGGGRTTGLHRILSVNDGVDNTLASVSIANLTFRDARMVAQFDQSVTPTVVRGAGGGCVLAVENITLASVTFDNCTSQGASEPGVPSNYSTGTGGAFWVGAASPTATAFPAVTLNQVSARNSQSLRSLTPYAVGSSANYSSFAGCIYVGGRTVGAVSITGLIAENCEADTWGGVAVHGAGATTINGITVTRSRAIGSPNADVNIDGGYVGGLTLRGGGNSVSPTGSMTASNIVVQYNTAGADRGGIEIRNLASFNGSGFDVLDNVSARYIGGVEIRDVVTGTLADSLILRNTAAASFGGFRARLGNASRTFTLNGVAVVHNLAAGSVVNGGGGGGGQFDSDGVYRLINSTVAFNRVGAGYFGGGLQVNMHSATVNGIDVLLSNSTIARNEAQGSEALGAYTFAPSSPLTNGRIIVQSSILGNRDGTATQNTVGASASEAAKITYSNALVEGPNSGVLNQGSVCVGTVICGPDAMLQPLIIPAAGLPFSLPIVLLPKPASLALNAGSNPLALTTDIRGQPRVNGVIDMGAVETQAAELIGACTLDMDGDNQALAFKEGLVLLRSMLGFTSVAAVANTGITESQWNATKANLNAQCGTNLQ
jgi:hypothetical protein